MRKGPRAGRSRRTRVRAPRERRGWTAVAACRRVAPHSRPPACTTPAQLGAALCFSPLQCWCGRTSTRASGCATPAWPSSSSPSRPRRAARGRALQARRGGAAAALWLWGLPLLPGGVRVAHAAPSHSPLLSSSSPPLHPPAAIKVTALGLPALLERASASLLSIRDLFRRFDTGEGGCASRIGGLWGCPTLPVPCRLLSKTLPGRHAPPPPAPPPDGNGLLTQEEFATAYAQLFVDDSAERIDEASAQRASCCLAGSWSQA